MCCVGDLSAVAGIVSAEKKLADEVHGFRGTFLAPMVVAAFVAACMCMGF